MKTLSTVSKQKKMRKLSKTYNLIEFIRPSSFWPNPYTLEDAYMLLTHLVRQASHVREQQTWGVASIWDTVSGSSGYGNHSLTLSAPTDIRDYWTNLLLRLGPKTIENWKSENNISPTATIAASTYRHKPFEPALRWTCEAAIKDAFKKFFTHYTNKKTTVSLNSIHTTAVDILQTSIIITEKSIIFRLSYGIHHSYGGTSRWSEMLSSVNEGESILHGLERALDLLDLLTKDKPDDRTVLTITNSLNQHALHCLKNSAYRLTDSNQPVISPFKPEWPHQNITP